MVFVSPVDILAINTCLYMIEVQYNGNVRAPNPSMPSFLSFLTDLSYNIACMTLLSTGSED